MIKVFDSEFFSYCVRPNAGFVAPDQEAEIKVMLQPGSIEEKHKFLVQSIIGKKLSFTIKYSNMIVQHQKIITSCRKKNRRRYGATQQRLCPRN